MLAFGLLGQVAEQVQGSPEFGSAALQRVAKPGIVAQGSVIGGHVGAHADEGHQLGDMGAELVRIAESEVVDDGHQAVKFEQERLQFSGSSKAWAAITAATAGLHFRRAVIRRA